MGLAWQAYGLGHLAKSIHGYYLVYRNFDNEMKPTAGSSNMRLESDRFGEHNNGLFGCAFIPRWKRFSGASDGVCEGQRAYEAQWRGGFSVGGFHLSAAHYFKSHSLSFFVAVPNGPS
jgi:hypothetical protein